LPRRDAVITIMSMDNVITLRVFEDNYIYLWPFEQGRALVVDPGDAAVVLDELDRRDLHLEAILATHHHADHVGGIRDIKRQTGARVIGPNAGRIPLIDHPVQEGEVLEFGSHRIQVMATPGHTSTSVCYYRPRAEGSGLLWTGDTLFQGGCGRLLECDAETLWRSLQRLAGLPEDTLVYCGHDYTLENYAFGLSIDPNNPDIKAALARARQSSWPSTIGLERRTNIFLLSDLDRIKVAVGAEEASPAQVFAQLRRRKDVF
jgi:hydroxyacylglutathione hydrolase